MKLFYENAHWHGRGPLYKIGAKDIIEKWFLRASIGGYGWIKPPVGSNKWGFKKREILNLFQPLPQEDH